MIPRIVTISVNVGNCNNHNIGYFQNQQESTMSTDAPPSEAVLAAAAAASKKRGPLSDESAASS